MFTGFIQQLSNSSGLERSGSSQARKGPLLWSCGKSIRIHQVCFDSRSLAAVDPAYVPYFNSTRQPFFENAVISDLMENGADREADYFGIFSWRFSRKIPLGANDILGRMSKDDCASDVYSFFGWDEGTRIWLQGETAHPGIIEATEYLLSKMGIRLNLGRIRPPVVFQNHFICRSRLYRKYYLEMLRPAILLMCSPKQRKLRGLLNRDANYRPDLPPEYFISNFGMIHATLHPFICERLFSTWLYLNPRVRFRQLWHQRAWGV